MSRLFKIIFAFTPIKTPSWYQASSSGNINTDGVAKANTITASADQAGVSMGVMSCY